MKKALNHQTFTFNNLRFTIHKQMFTIRANHSETTEFNANLEKVIEFFSDYKNSIELMPLIESIHKDNNDILHWKIRADVPLIGSFVEKFAVRETEHSDERIEWSPAESEKFNFLRYSADFMPKSKDITLVKISQNIEMRRNSATDLHLLAGFAGESLISNEMSRRIGEMLKNFIEKARQRLEN